MAKLTATFKLVDEMSDKLANIASGGQQMLSKFEEMGNAADNFFYQINEGSESAVKAVEEISSSFKGYESNINSAANSVGNWTDKVGNYSKSMLEAIYSTEELVDMGLKTADALIEEGEMLSVCETAAASLNKEIEFSIDAQTELNSVIELASEVMKEVSENENILAETKRELANASEYAAQAIQELEIAAQAAKEAIDNYDNTIVSGTTGIKKFNEEAATASQAAEKLSEANKKAVQATEKLGKISKEAAEECEKAGNRGGNAFENMAEALAAASIVALIKDISFAAYELADAFLEAESTVVKATGATGEALDELNESMMNAYAASKSGSSLDDISGAIGEINTRMALTGDTLTDVTGQFLDFSNITGTDVVGSVQNVTKIMNRWGIEGENVESVLDKLSYAGQISGISVDALSSNLISGAAIFQEVGLSLDNAVSMLADFELAGINGSAAITAMRTAIKNFTGEGLNTAEALPSVIEEIANMGNESEATALAVKTFGSRAGIDMANAIKNGTITVESFTGSLEAATGTLDRTAENSQTLSQKWQQASNKISAAFTSALQPALDKASSGFADIMNSIGDFLNAHPALTKGIAAAGVAVGTFAVILTTFALVTCETVKTAVNNLTAAVMANPIFAGITIGIGVITGIATFIGLLDDAEDEMADMTETTKAQYNELQRVNAEYERACEIHGKDSVQAGELALQISRLEEEYERTKKTVEEFTAEIEENKETLENISQTYNEAITSADDLYENSIFLTSQLLALSNQSDMTGTTLDIMSRIVNKLNSSYEDLGLTIDTTTGKLNYSIPELYDYISKMNEKNKQAAAAEGLMSTLEKYNEIRDNNQQAIQEYEQAVRGYQELKDRYNEIYGYKPGQVILGTGRGEELTRHEVSMAEAKMDKLSEKVVMTQANYDMLTSSLRTYYYQLGYTNEEIDEFIRQLENSAYTAENLSEQTDFYEAIAGAVSIAYNSVRAEIQKLCEAYDEAYKSAYTSFQNQFGLFDEAQTNMDATVEKAKKALGSQLEYWEDYNSNMEVLKNFSYDNNEINKEDYDALMKYIVEGGEDAAGFAADIRKYIESGNIEGIKEVIELIYKVDEQQKTAADSVAKWQEDFDSKMKEISDKMEKTVVEDMNLSEEAEISARGMILAYAEEIKNGQGAAVDAAKNVANEVAGALSGKSTILPTISMVVQSAGKVRKETTPSVLKSIPAYALPGNANGTTNAEDIFVAGEEGPELIVGKAGSTVFPAKETDKIISALDTAGYINVTNNYTAADTAESAGFSAYDAERILAEVKEKPLRTEVPKSFETRTEQSNYNYNETKSEKRIILEINGSGAIDMGDSFDEERAVNFMYANIKPVLLDIFRAEKYEEGEASYVF